MSQYTQISGVYRLAKMMIKRYSTSAAEHAMQYALDMQEQGDRAGEALWLKVFDQIREWNQANKKTTKLH